MHITIAVPDDTPIDQLCKALASIGLDSTSAPGWMIHFDHGKAPAAPLCQVDGCDAKAVAQDGHNTTCARHWLASRA
jgi:hypothetical protein